jgi:CRISPR system Cascade subunit CasD
MPLVGPMQSWGHRSRFDDRDTGLEPTRSGVIGLICAAMGIPRDGDLSQFDRLRMGARVDAPGRVMVDYHTAKDVIRADGDGLGTVVSHRHYLSDARFLVGLESDDIELLKDIELHLQRPVWPIFLGRKSFVPSVPVSLPGGSVMAGKALEQALMEYPFVRMREWERMPSDDLRMVIESRERVAGELTRNDVPLDFAQRRFGLRQVRTDWIAADKLQDGGVWPCTSPGS